MTLLDRYIARTLLSAVALVMAVLLVLGMLFVFIGEQGDVGVGHYGMLDALAVRRHVGAAVRARVVSGRCAGRRAARHRRAGAQP